MPNPALTEGVYYILLSLLQPLHGYGIIQNVEKLSAGRVRLAAGTLYGAINTLLEKAGSSRWKGRPTAAKRNMSSPKPAGKRWRESCCGWRNWCRTGNS